MENSLNHPSDAKLAQVRRFGDLVWADGNLFAYTYRGEIFVMEPPEGITKQLIPILDQHPIYAEVAEQEFNEEVFQLFDEGYEGIILDEASEVDWPMILDFGGQQGVEGIKVEYIEPQEIVPEIFGETTKAPDSLIGDPAVLMHTIHEMAYTLRETRQLLKDRMYGNGVFIQKEVTALNESAELLTDYCNEFGVNFENQKDLKLDGVKLELG